MTIGEAVRFTQSFYSHWNNELLDQILDHFALPHPVNLDRLTLPAHPPSRPTG